MCWPVHRVHFQMGFFSALAADICTHAHTGTEAAGGHEQTRRALPKHNNRPPNAQIVRRCVPTYCRIKDAGRMLAKIKSQEITPPRLLLP